ncbi:MAG TPA: FapA family protein, partial [bacterium]|nr:FapA family protein [bacterium]
MSVELKLIVDLEYLYIEKLCLWLVERLKDPTQGDDIVLLTEVLYFLTDRIFFDVIDEKNAVNCFVNFDNNNITLLFSKIPSEILKHKRNELLAIKKKIDKIEYNEKEETLIVNKYFFVEDSAFDQELNSAIKDIQEVSVQSSDNIDDSFMSLNAADAENIINRLKNFDKRNLYCFDRFIYDYSSTDILKNLFYFRRAVAGQLLAATQLPIIKSKVFKEIIAGENIASSKDRKAYYSKISGRVRWQGETLEVNAVKSIDQTLKNYVQPLKIDNATLIVNGSLMSCANIVVEKDLYVFGNIIDTNIDVKGNIYVAGRIENCNGAKSVKAGGDIIVLAIYNSIVNTESNLLVSEEIINSDINVGADILLDGENRKIIGGSIKAGRAITCSILGNGETETKILLSADSPANSERKQL